MQGDGAWEPKKREGGKASGGNPPSQWRALAGGGQSAEDDSESESESDSDSESDVGVTPTKRGRGSKSDPKPPVRHFTSQGVGSLQGISRF